RCSDGGWERAGQSGRQGSLDWSGVDRESSCRSGIWDGLRSLLDIEKRLPNPVDESLGLALRSLLIDHPPRMNCARPAQASSGRHDDNIGAGWEGRCSTVSDNAARANPRDRKIGGLEGEELRVEGNSDNRRRVDNPRSLPYE